MHLTWIAVVLYVSDEDSGVDSYLYLPVFPPHTPGPLHYLSAWTFRPIVPLLQRAPHQGCKVSRVESSDRLTILVVENREPAHDRERLELRDEELFFFLGQTGFSASHFRFDKLGSACTGTSNQVKVRLLRFDNLKERLRTLPEGRGMVG